MPAGTWQPDERDDAGEFTPGGVLLPTFGRALVDTRALSVLRRDIATEAPGTDIPFTLSTPGAKRDGLDLAGRPFYLDRYRDNPVVLPFHNADTFPCGRGEIEETAVGRGTVLRARAWFDLEDEVGAIADRKYRQLFLHAVSLSWQDVDPSGIPVRSSRQAVAAHDVLEFSIVSVPGDWTALAERGAGRRSRSRLTIEQQYRRWLERGGATPDDITRWADFLRDARDVLPSGERRERIAEVLRRLQLCDGAACAVLAGGMMRTPTGAATRELARVDVTTTVADAAQEGGASGMAELSPDDLQAIGAAVAASLTQAAGGTAVSVNKTKAKAGQVPGMQAAEAVVTFTLPPDLVARLAQAAVADAASVAEANDGTAMPFDEDGWPEGPPATELGMPAPSAAGAAEGWGRDAADSNEASAEELWQGAALVMRSLYCEVSNEADDRQRHAVYKSLLPDYWRARKVPPKFVPAAFLRPLSVEARRSLLLEGEGDMVMIQGTGQRRGTAIGSAKRQRIRGAADGIKAAVKEIGKHADDLAKMVDEVETAGTGERGAGSTSGAGRQVVNLTPDLPGADIVRSLLVALGYDVVDRPDGEDIETGGGARQVDACGCGKGKPKPSSPRPRPSSSPRPNGARSGELDQSTLDAIAALLPEGMRVQIVANEGDTPEATEGERGQRGAALGDALYGVIEAMFGPDEMVQSQAVIDTATTLGIDPEVVLGWLNGEGECPDLTALQGLADQWGADPQLLIDAATADGCTFDLPEADTSPVMDPNAAPPASAEMVAAFGDGSDRSAFDALAERLAKLG